MKADHSVDCIGLYCPMPIVKASQIIKEMKTGEVLEMLADDQGVKLDIPAWCEATGHEFLGVEEEGGEIKVYLKKTGE